jgi:hypothetical protein
MPIAFLTTVSQTLGESPLGAALRTLLMRFRQVVNSRTAKYHLGHSFLNTYEDP